MDTRSKTQNKNKMSIESITKDINKMVQLFEDLKKEVKSMKCTLNDLTNSTENINGSTERIEKEIRGMDDKLSQMDRTVQETDRKYMELSKKFNDLNERVIKMEGQTRRNNLLFNGVPQTQNESKSECLKKIRTILEQTLKLDNAKTMQIVRCHRMEAPVSGPRSGTPGRPGTIICTFQWHGDRMAVWNAKKHLRDTEYRLQEDFPKEMQDRRKTLMPIMFAARRLDGHDAYLTVDKLHIVSQQDGRKVHNVYDVTTLHKLPESLDLRNVCTIKKDKMLAFFGFHCPLSNFHPAPFISEGQKYRHVEEYLFVKKAEFAKDDVTKQKIFAADTPAECKNIGRFIKVDYKQWRTKEVDVMKTALYEKFHQNGDLRDYLLNTKDLTLAEASPLDRFWGIGAGLGVVASSKEQTFTGKNKLGELLMELRAQLR